MALFLLFVSGPVLSQTDATKAQTGRNNQESAKPENTQPDIKAVPAVKNKTAKPKRINSAKPANVAPRATRPARNSRPSSRPARPGTGRN